MQNQILAIFLTSLIGVFASAADFKLINLKDDFKIYVDNYRGESLDQQYLGWDHFLNKHPALYESGKCAAEDVKCLEKLKLRIGVFFEQLPKFENKMWDLFDRAETITSTQIQRFRKAFPDLGTDAPIYFLPSMGSFNGKSKTISGISSLLIAPDFVAMRNDNVDVLFTHECFHLYQFNRLQGREVFETLISPLWFEGFATWISQQLNPEASANEIFMDSVLATYCSDQSNAREMAVQFSQILSLKIDDSALYSSTYSDWFLMIGTTQPVRRGYCLGYLVVKELAKTHDVHELLLLDEDGFVPLVKEVFAKIAQTNLK